MEEIPISKFKATCLAVLERVRTSGEPVLVTRHGHPVARIETAAPKRRLARRPMGSMVGTGQILGDIVAPAFDEKEWDALR